MQKNAIKILPADIWTKRAARHKELIEPIANAFIRRRATNLKEPVEDFLFTYYSMSPTKLKQWVPAWDEALEMPEALRDVYPWLDDCRFQWDGEVLTHRNRELSKNILGIAQFIETLCDNILNKPAKFGCYGMHEWAMVYKLSQDSLRHRQLSLRMPSDELNRFVEKQPICCTHYDAFRFFTEEAKPLNNGIPRLESRLEWEQAGCIHANMDLYKWSIKLWPWIGSEFIAKAFFVALEARVLDMRASPYDLVREGYSPICIETEEGRKHYIKEQHRIVQLSTPLRQQLKEFCCNFRNNFY